MNRVKEIILIISLTFSFLLAGCDLTAKGTQDDKEEIALENLQGLIAYCYRSPDDESTSEYTENGYVFVVLSFADKSDSFSLRDAANIDQSEVNMHGCYNTKPDDLITGGDVITWRPNYNQLAYTKGSSSGTPFFEFVQISETIQMEYLGTGPVDYWKDWYENFANIRNLTWHPDGEKLAVLGENIDRFGYDIWIYDVNTDESFPVTITYDIEEVVFTSSWSPDGDAIAVGLGTPDTGIIIAEIGEAELNNYLEISSATVETLLQWPHLFDNIGEYLTPGKEWFVVLTYQHSQPVWVNNSEQIIFTGMNQNQDATLFIVNRDGTELRELMPDLQGLNIYPHISPDGKLLSFLHYEDWDALDNAEIMIFDFETSTYKSILKLKNQNRSQNFLTIRGMSWSPDNEFIAFGSGHDGEQDIYIISKDGSEIINWTQDLPGAATSPSWNP